jgi:hypothetical protein
MKKIILFSALIIVVFGAVFYMRHNRDVQNLQIDKDRVALIKKALSYLDEYHIKTGKFPTSEKFHKEINTFDNQGRNWVDYGEGAYYKDPNGNVIDIDGNTFGLAYHLVKQRDFAVGKDISNWEKNEFALGSTFVAYYNLTDKDYRQYMPQ